MSAEISLIFRWLIAWPPDGASAAMRRKERYSTPLRRAGAAASPHRQYRRHTPIEVLAVGPAG